MSLVVCSLLAETLLNSIAGTFELALRCGEAIKRSRHAKVMVGARANNGGPKKRLLMTDGFKRVFLPRFEAGLRIIDASPKHVE